MADYTERYLAFMEKLAVGYNINIVGGSHPTRVDNGDIRNIAYVFLRDGSVQRQEKLHPTPSERRWWNSKGDYGAGAPNTDHERRSVVEGKGGEGSLGHGGGRI